MPIQYGKDKKGCYVKWGRSGAKYHYKCGDASARERARKKANKQAVAISYNSNNPTELK